MVELVALSPCRGLLPLDVGDLRLREDRAGVLTSVIPFVGMENAVSDLLKSAHGLSMPAPNRSIGKTGNRVLWFGRGQVLLAGPDPDPRLAEHAALGDQSDAWAVVRLDGGQAQDVLARLVPVDLRPGQFKRGHTIRTELGHMVTSITRIGASSFQIMAFRSMAKTLVHDLKTAMEGVAARG